MPRPSRGLCALLLRWFLALAWVGLVRQPESDVLGGLPLTPSEFRKVRAHGPHMRMDHLSTPTGKPLARASAFVATGDRRLDHATSCLFADCRLCFRF